MKDPSKGHTSKKRRNSRPKSQITALEHEYDIPITARLPWELLCRIETLIPHFFPEKGASPSRSAVIRRTLEEGLKELEPKIFGKLQEKKDYIRPFPKPEQTEPPLESATASDDAYLEGVVVDVEPVEQDVVQGEAEVEMPPEIGGSE